MNFKNTFSLEYPPAENLLESTRMLKYFLQVVVLILILLPPSISDASLVITLGRIADTGTGTDVPLGGPGAPEGPFMPGDTFTLGVYAHETELGAVNLDEFNFVLDIGAQGLNMGPSPFSVNATSFTSGPVGSYNPVVAPNAFSDFGMGFTSGTSFLVSDDATDPTLLFSLDVGIDPMAAEGIYDLNVVTPDGGTGPYISGATSNFGLFRFRNNNADTFAPIIFDHGQVQVVAIPEPGSMLALAGLFVAGGLRRWRKTKRAVEASAAG